MKTINLDTDKILLVSSRIVQPGNQYQYGAKIADLEADSSKVRKLKVDCSGYVRYLLRRGGLKGFPDGSYNQHEWVDQQEFNRAPVREVEKDQTGILYIVFLPPRDPHPGHVALVHNGMTLESCGGEGPTRRKFSLLRWRGRCTCYQLTTPPTPTG